MIQFKIFVFDPYIEDHMDLIIKQFKIQLIELIAFVYINTTNEKKVKKVVKRHLCSRY